MKYENVKEIVSNVYAQYNFARKPLPAPTPPLLRSCFEHIFVGAYAYGAIIHSHSFAVFYFLLRAL